MTPPTDEPDEVGDEAGDEGAADRPQPRPQAGSAEAAAARRARRIGGRAAGPKPTPTPAQEPAAESAPIKARRPKPEPVAADGDLDERPGRTPPPWLNWLPAGVLSVGALAMAVVLIVASHGVWWGPDASAPAPAGVTNVKRERVLAAAKTCLAATNTYQYTALDAYEQKALACATGEFVGQLRTTIENLIKVNAPKLKSSQTAQINRGGIEAVSSSGRQWTILLFGQLTVVNADEKNGRTDPFGAQVVMERVGTKWLIAKLTTVSTPVS